MHFVNVCGVVLKSYNKQINKEAYSLGIYVNPTGRSFELAINSEIFVDKSGLIKETNKCINTLQR